MIAIDIPVDRVAGVCGVEGRREVITEPQTVNALAW